IVIGAWGPINGGIAKNNICYQSAGEGTHFMRFSAVSRLLESLDEWPKITDYDIDRNLYFAAGVLYSSQKQLEGLQAQNVEQNSRVADPLFEGFESAGFKLKENSPAFELGIKQLEFE